jgi:uncharacterized RDD family membrane protein YckC
MPQELTLLTPEKVEVTFRLAGIPSRVWAYLLDKLFYFTGMGIIFLTGILLFGLLHLPAALADIAATIYLYLFVAGFFAYPILSDIFMNGQTFAKRILGLRVVMVNGAPITTPAAILRELFITADFLPSVFLVGAIAMFLSERSQRVGDMVAGTIVVISRRPHMQKAALDRFEVPEHHLEDRIRSVSALNEADLVAIRTFLARYPDLPMAKREQLYREIWASIASRCQFEIPPGASPLVMLAAIERKLARDLAGRDS